MKRVLLVVVPLTVVGGVLYARSTRPDGVLEYLERAQPYRVFAPRVSIETEHRPCTVNTDSIVPVESCGDPRYVPRELPRFDAGAESVHPDSLRASALADVIWWSEKPASLDSAIERLSYARVFTRNRVPLLVDLSALHLVRAQRTQNAQDVAQALDYALEALDLEPRNLLALFNAALAAQALSIREGALSLWDDYLAADTTSPWASEARSRRDTLLADTVLAAPDASATRAQVEAFARGHPQIARELGWETVLGEWGQAALQGPAARADSLLTRAEWLGSALRSQGGDQSLADAVAAIRAAHGDADATRRLARAHRAYAAGCGLVARGLDGEAISSFAEALSLNPPSHALMGWVRASRAVSLVISQRGDDAEPDLRTLIAETDSVLYPALAARAHWSLGHVLRPHSSEAARLHFSQAAGTYARLREWESYGGVRYREAWANHEKGDSRSAYRVASESLRVLRPYRASRHLHATLGQAAALVERDGMPRAARFIQAEDYRVAMRLPELMPRVEALMARARMLALADSASQALGILDGVASIIPNLPDLAQAKYSMAALQYSRTFPSSPERAGYAASLDSAVSYFRKEEKPAWVVTILLARAELRLAANDLRGADADLDRITEDSRGLPSRGPDAHLRAAVMERLRSQYDRLVMGYVRNRQPLHALQALDRSRISFAPHRAATPRWTLPQPGTVVVEYALIGDTLLTWVVRPDSITLREQRLNAEELRRTVARVGSALESPRRDQDAEAWLRSLYDTLIRPVRDHIPGTAAGRETELVIVADGELAGLPFAALMNGEQYLVHDHPIRFAAAVADASLVADRSPVDGPVLLVANPDFDRYEHAGLGGLPGAVEEVDSVASLYSDVLRLADTSATTSAFRTLAGRASVIHFAGHAVFDDSRPERSFLLLADSGTAGQLMANDSLDLGNTRLVVLSACRTLRGHRGRSGGFAGLSGAMLQAGAEGVVGSLWWVDDDLVQPLMMEFHRAYRAQRDPARALRAAQLQMIQSDSSDRSSPAAWAGFRYMGR
jgi:CHAT domain-containing protein